MRLKNIKKLTAIVLAGAMCMGMTACGSSSDNASDSGSASASESSKEDTAAVSTAAASETSESAAEDSSALKEIDVVLDWYPNAIHTFLYEAIDNGYFEEEGLKVNLVEPAESVDAINFVASGRAQIGLTYPVEVCQAVENDMPVKALAAVSQKALDCLASLASNKDITSDMSSLKGHKIGYSGTAVSKATITTIAENAGLSEDDYELVDVGFDLVTSLTTGSVDLTAGTFINDEVITMEQNGYDVNVYYEQDYGVPELYGLVMAVNSDDYEANADIYDGFLNACKKGFEDMKADEDAAIDLIMNEMASDENPLDEEQQRGSYEVLMERMETEDGAFLSMKDETWQEIIDWMKKSGLLESDLSPADVTVSE